MIEIWTDGSCIPNPGRGGWAWACKCGTSASGAEDVSTNQRMEIRAVIEALRANSADGEDVTIYTDSQFVIHGATRWIGKWLKNGWRTVGGAPVKNRELWEELWDQVGKRVVVFRWVPGHSGNVMNELVDRLANEATGASPEDRAEMNRRIAAQKGWSSSRKRSRRRAKSGPSSSRSSARAES